ncbi:uncharacterized protein [Asterias amurensis]|uniref:uncharacterized protein n=1 Tax=Asterias amurensis TaxID=7602 RepID=UPI003AB8B025
MFNNSTIEHRVYKFAMEQHQKWMRFAGLIPKAVFPWIAIVLLVWTLPVAVMSTGRPYWYEPPCRKQDFTWTTQSGRMPGCSYVEIRDGCSNPLPPLRDESLRPPPVSNVQMEYYTTEFISADEQYRQWEGIWSCLNFTFQIGPEAAGKIQGILFSMRSLNIDSDDYGDLICRAFDFGGPLDADALIGEDGTPLKLFFDCFRGQKPGMEYEYTIRTLPVIDINGDDPRDTAVTMRYRTQSCYYIPNDYLCIDKSEGVLRDNELCAHWKPQYLLVSSEYLDLSVEVELGPEECGFNTFRISVPTVTDHNSGRPSGFTDFDVKNMSYYQTFKYGRQITFIRVNLNTGPGQRLVKITPQPDLNTCFTKDGQDRMCSITLSAEFKIIENPCLSGPTHCSDSVHDCKPVGSEAICVCKPGYMEDDNGRCIKNPCSPLDSATQKPYNPCGVGTCIINPTQDGYFCNCSYGYKDMDGTCKEDPCYQNSGSENNVCGYHGECQYAANGDSVSVKHICTCDTGYEYNISEQTCQVSTKTLVVVIFMSLLVVVILIQVLVVWKCYREPGSLVYQALHKCRKGEEGIMVQDISPTQSVDNVPIGTPNNSRERIEIIQPSKRVKTLLLYSNDDPLHEHAVQTFVKFLEAECMCDVETPSNDIALMGKCQWISHTLQWADKVILLCSRGTYINWGSNCRTANPPDIFTQALAYILNSLTSLSLPDKFCVAYFDYSHRNDIPGPLSVGAVFCLMKHMDSLFFRLHDMTPGSPRSTKYAPNLEEKNYAALSTHGKRLHSAIKSAHELQREAADWSERLSNDLLRGRHQDLPSIPPHLLDNTSQVDDEDFEESLRKLKNINSSCV